MVIGIIPPLIPGKRRMTKLNESRNKAVAVFSTRKREIAKAIYSNIFDEALKVDIPPGNVCFLSLRVLQ